MTDFPPKESAQNTAKTEVDYQLLDRLVEENPNLTDEQILKRYQLEINTPPVTLALLSDDLNDATKVILASALPDQHPPKSTQSQAQYRIDHRIDSGGQSHVYLAHRNDGTYQKTVVIKVLNQTIEGATQKQQLMAEMQILADLKHPNIVSILDAGIDDQQRPWLMLDFISGEHIDQFIRSHTISPHQLLKLFISIAKALKYIHLNHVVHADIKPANIMVEMLDNQPQPIIIDFGIASTQENKAAGSAYIFATPAFASPEQLDTQAGPIDNRSDIYSFGQVMQHLLDIQTQTELSTSNNPQDLAAIIDQCVAPMPAYRYQDMSTLLSDLQRYQRGEVVSARQPAIGQLMTRTLRKFKWQFTLALLLTTLSIFLVNHSIKQTQQSNALLKGAESSQYYWQSADEISNQSRLIYALPMRNIEPDFKLLNFKFDDLLKKIKDEPESTQNLSHLPLANAGISLGRYDQAHELLLRAHANNPNNAEVKFKLGKNYLTLYQNEVQSLQNFSLPTERQAQRQRLQQKYFDPALMLFDGVEYQEYDDQLITSLLHYFEGNYEQALQQLEVSKSQLLWPIERLLLAAQITQEQAGQLLLSRQTETATPLLNQAIELLTQAKQIARSHPEVYKQLCQIESQLLQLEKNQDLTTIKSCDDFTSILPQTPAAILVAADAYAQLAKLWLDQGQTPDQLLNQSRYLLEHPWHTESNDHYAHAEQIKGDLLGIEGKWHLYSNQEFIHNFKQAIKHHQQAVDKQPNSYSAQLKLATAWYNLATNAQYSSDHTDHDFIEATKLLTQLTQHADSTQFLPVFIVRVLTDHAYIRYQNGLSADHQLTEAEQWVRQSQTDFPESLYAQLATATLYWTYSDYLALQGKNPQPYLEQAIAAFDQVITIEPSLWTNRYNQISAMLSGVTYYLEQGTSQTSQLQTIKSKLEILETLISSSINLDSHWGYYYNMLASNQTLLNENPEPSLKQAWHHNATCANSPVDGYVCYGQLATSLLAEIKWNNQHPGNLVDFHKSHLKKIQQGILQHPDHHQLLARYGEYLWLKSKEENVVSQISTLQQAHEHLMSATIGNPLLAEKFAGPITAIEANIAAHNQTSN